MAVRISIPSYYWLLRFIVQCRFPLGSDTGLARALADKAIDSFGCSTSLLEFHEIYPRCAMSGSSALLEVEMPKVEENEDDDDDDEKEPERLLKTHNDDKLLSIPARKIKISDSDPDHPLYAYTVPHPHIVTRSQIRIVEETRQFDLKAYNKAHKELQGKYVRLSIASVSVKMTMSHSVGVRALQVLVESFAGKVTSRMVIGTHE